MPLFRRRKVLLHYHIFKNAGTSIDHVLEECFARTWRTFDKDRPGAKITAAEMDAFLREHRSVRAVSSHQVIPPLPSRVADIYPILFLRHPIDRAYSAYLFEWGKQVGQARPERPFAEYVEEKFQHPRQSAIEDFQVQHLANTNYDTPAIRPDTPAAEVLERATAFLDSLPCFGLVERYEESLAQFADTYRRAFPKFRPRVVRVNALQDAALTLEEKLARIRGELGAERYAELEARNKGDLALYAHALERFGA